MMALSMIFASPVAMKPPRRMASWIGCWHRDPMSASCGNQVRNAARSPATLIWPVKNLGGIRSGSRWWSILLPATIWVRDMLALMWAMTSQAVAVTSSASCWQSIVMRSGQGCSSAGAVSRSAAVMWLKSPTFAACAPILCMPPSRQHGVGIFEELPVVQQRPDCLVLAAPFDGPQMEVRTWPGERFISLDYSDALGKASNELFHPPGQPACHARSASPPLAIRGQQEGRGLTAVAGRIHELARRPLGPHDEPIRSELPADHVDVDPVHLRGLGDLIII
jgi:hypothetical protein